MSYEYKISKELFSSVKSLPIGIVINKALSLELYFNLFLQFEHSRKRLQVKAKCCLYHCLFISLFLLLDLFFQEHMLTM